MKIKAQRICAIIPSFNHSAKLAQITQSLIKQELAVIIVDDASSANHAKNLQKINDAFDDIHLVRHAENQGKGGAVITGLITAQKLGYSHALQVDADGQHDLNDIKKLLDLAQQYPQALISGQPVYDESIPKGRLWGRSITHFWVHIETLSLQVQDTMCGFRVYPLTSACQLIEQVCLGKRMDFDIEIMVRLFWRNVDIKFIPTKIEYPQDGQSHFRALHDNLLISWLHTRLVLGMLVRLPYLLTHRFLTSIKRVNNGVINDDN